MPIAPVRDLKQSEVGAASQLLANAFLYDPIWIFVFPELELRKRFLPHLFRGWIHCARSLGKAWATNGLEGIALRRLPGKYELSPFQRALFFSAVEIGAEPVARLLHLEKELRKRFEKASVAHQWYFWILAVAPEWRGKGFGRSLREHSLDAMEKSGAPAYLETTCPRVAREQVRHGFQIISEEKIPGPNLPIWSLQIHPKRVINSR